MPVPPVEDFVNVEEKRKARESEPVKKTSPQEELKQSWRMFFRIIFPSRGESPIELNLSVLFCLFLLSVVKKKRSYHKEFNSEKSNFSSEIFGPAANFSAIRVCCFT